MNIPLFEILILLFVLWPLIQRFLEKNKPNQNPDSEADFPYDTADDPFSESPRRNKADQPDWDQAMRELEMIFTGERPSQPTQKEIEQGTERMANLERSKEDGSSRGAALRRQAEIGSSRREAMLRNNESREHSGGRLNPETANTRRTQLEGMTTRSLKQTRTIRPEELASAEEMVEQLMESENPIYTSLSVAPEIQDESSDKNFTVYSDIRNPQRLREFYVMKEILDKPVSKRRVQNFV
ncbi:MAG: hypothetical protein JJU41_05855 [Bacteroidetes bacterium]|nr:hypothetical protein [Bacteroidota bacterium]MCH8523077.1 hypothetical protein [Balneolales bacterium]